MRPPAVQTIVIAAGGTGGHFFPAEALAAEMMARGHRIVLMTDGRSAAIRSAVCAGCEQHVIYGAGIAYEVSPSFDIRTEYRGLVLKVPSFGVSQLVTNKWYNIYAPSIGVAYHF